MKHKLSEQRSYNIILLALAFGITFVNLLPIQPEFVRITKSLFVSFTFTGLILFWCITIIGNIGDKYSRRIVKGIASQLILWMLLRDIKYSLCNLDVENMLWYLYYVPQMLLPLLVFQLTVYIDGVSRRKILLTRWLYLPAAVLIVGILTNNLHQLAYRFAGGIVSGSGPVVRGPLYYLSLVWLAGFMVGAACCAERKSRLQNRKKAMFLLLAWVAMVPLYMVYYFVGPFWTRTYLFNFPEAVCLFIMIFIEICLQTGLIGSNRYHKEILKTASVMAEITDQEDHRFAKSDICAPISDEEKAAVSLDHPLVKEGFELRVKGLSGGKIYWRNDLRKILKVNDQLRETAQQLAEENHILEAEIAIREKKAALETQNEILDQVSAAIGSKAGEIIGLLEDPLKLKQALVLAAYMKRKGNLVILSRQEQTLDIRELGLCINESLSYARLGGCICSCMVSGEGCLDTELIMNFYDLFETVLEASYEGLQALLCNVRLSKESLTMRLQIDHEDPAFSERFHLREDSPVTIWQEIQDNTLYLSFVKEVRDGE